MIPITTDAMETKTDILNQVPQAPEVEAAIIGAIITDGGEVFERVASILKPAMFFDPQHAKLFEILADMYQGNHVINLISTVQTARDRNQGETLTPLYLSSLTRTAAAITEVAGYARIVAEKSAARHVLRRLEEIREAVYNNMPLDTIGEDVARLDGEINEVFTGGDTGADMAEVMREVLTLQEDKINNYRAGRVSGVQTGFLKLDNRIGGFRPGTFTLIAGRPGSGKTSLALHFAEFAAIRHNTPVLFFSYEMTREQIGEILAAKRSGVDRLTIRDGRATDNELQRIHRGAGDIERYNIRVFDNASHGVDRIAAITKRHVKRHGLTLVIVDYLQLIPPEDKKATREQQVSAISRGLKRLSMILKIPVVCLAQLNREAEDATEPQLKHLRESGALEQDADTVILIYQQPAEDADNLLILKVAKNRHGETGRAPIFRNNQFTAFSESESFNSITADMAPDPEATGDDSAPVLPF